MDWEDYCYDDDHRNFFRFLRSRQVDVFSVYECMRCSEDFLSCLHRRSILTGHEYDELLDSLKTSSVSLEINKQLIGIINKKLPKVQEMFADQLCHYHTNPVIVDEEASASSGELT